MQRSTLASLAAVLVSLTVLMGIRWAYAVSFSADMVVEYKGKTAKYPFYYTDGIYRYDKTEDGIPLYFLVKQKADYMTFVVPSKKVYCKVPKEAAFLMAPENVIEAQSFAAPKYYQLVSESKERLGPFSCKKQVYNHRKPMEKIKASEVWIAEKYRFPIKILTFYKGKVLARFELKNIKEGQLKTGLLIIPPEFNEITIEQLQKLGRQPQKPKRPQWRAKVSAVPLLSPPFEKRLNQGDIIRVKVVKGHSIEFRMESSGKEPASWARVEYYAFKNGKLVKNLGIFGGSAAPKFKEPPHGADEIVLRVLKGTARLWAGSAPSNLIKLEHLRGSSVKFYSLPKGKRVKLTLTDDPSDQVTSHGKVLFCRGSRTVAQEGFRLRGGASRSWDVGKFKKVDTIFVKLKKGAIDVRIEDVSRTVSAPVQTKEIEKGLKVLPSPSHINYGLWKISRAVVVPGLSKPAPMDRTKLCIAKDNYIPLKESRLPNCKITNLKVKGSRVTWDFVLTAGDINMVCHGQAVYRGDTMDGVYQVTVGEKTKINYRLTGQRIGKCGKV